MGLTREQAYELVGIDRPNGQPTPQPDHREPSRWLHLTRASDIQPKPVHWTWQDRMPAGALTLWAGREGIGKSLALVWVTAALTTGQLPGRHYGTARPVIYAATEDSWEHTIVPRLIAAGADLSLVFCAQVREVQGDRITSLTLPQDIDALTRGIRQQGVALVALDPLMSVIPAGIDTHRDRELRTSLEPIAAMADATGVAVAALSHFNKSASSDVMNLITGSRAFSAVARAAIGMARDTDADDGSCVLSQAKNNLGRLDLPSLRYVVDTMPVDTDEETAFVGRLRFVGETDRTVSDILSDASTAEERGERDAAAEWLQGYLTDCGGEAPGPDVKKAARGVDIAERTLQRACKRAGVTIERRGFGQGSVWVLSPFAPHPRHSRQDTEAGANGANGGANVDETPVEPESLQEAIPADRPQRWHIRNAPADAVPVDRRTRWGNPYKVKEHGRAMAVVLHHKHLLAGTLPAVKDSPVTVADVRQELAGRDLACWCGPDEACHADTLLTIANPNGDTHARPRL